MNEEQWEDQIFSEREVSNRSIEGILVARYAADLADELKRVREANKKGRVGYTAQFLMHGPLDPLQVATLALTSLVGLVLKGPEEHHKHIGLTYAMGKVASAVEQEVRIATFRKSSPDAAGYMAILAKRLADDGKTNPVSMMRAGKNIMVKLDYATGSVYNRSEKIAIGGELVQLMLQVTPIFKTYSYYLGKKGVRSFALAIDLSDETAEWVLQAKAKLAEHQDLIPMIEPPHLWDDKGDNGGYHTISFPFIKTKPGRDQPPLPLGNRPKVCNILGSIQHRINPFIYNLCREMAANQHPNAPHIKEPKEPGEKPTEKIALAAWIQELREQRRDSLNSLYELQRWESTLDWAQKLLGRPYYHPHNIDFRGRMYGLPVKVKLQGDSLEKALQMSHKGAPMTADGAGWLAAHVAGVWGLDKESWETRREWTMANTDWLLDVAVSPMDHLERIFAEADDPWAFLAACHEWSRYIEDPQCLTYLPITHDATCSGFQHQAGLWRDPNTARLVNLCGGQRQDIYNAVAERTKRLLLLDDSPFAPYWLSLIDRSLVKRPVMIQPYAGTRRSMGDYAVEEYKQRRKDLKTDVDFFAPSKIFLESHGVKTEGAVIKHAMYHAGWYIGGKIEQAVKEVAPGGAKHMKYFKAIADEATNEGVFLHWGVDGDSEYPEVYQGYLGGISRTVHLHLWGKKRVRYIADSDKPARKSGSMPPNIIHWLDSQQLSRAVLANKEGGIDYQVCIHDCMGVLAPHVGTMRQNIMNAYSDMYAGDVPLLHRIHKSLIDHTQHPFPEPPEVGDWDPNVARDAMYAYC